MRLLSVLGCVLVLAAPAAGAAAELHFGPPVRVAEVPAGNRLVLADGREVRLAGIRVPDQGARAARARAALTAAALGHAVRLAPAAHAHDRYGHLVAQVERVDGLWLQGRLLEQGIARVQTRPGEVARADAMRARERAARAAGAGLWGDPAFAPRRADEVGPDVGSFQIVTGRVHRVAPTDDHVYLNFDRDWRTDFTIRLRRAELDERFVRSGIDVERLAGRMVEVRGLVLEAGGPLIEVSHPEQIEVLP